jgi:glycine cleavage system protein P-like pyridoxal-binding family
MKYSPKVNEALTRMPQMIDLHPLQPEETLQGILQIIWELESYLKAISGMDAFSFQTGAAPTPPTSTPASPAGTTRSGGS